MTRAPASLSWPDAIQRPADARAFIAVKKSLDAQQSEAASLVALLDPNIGKNLNASA
jgi:hypothetical protein